METYFKLPANKSSLTSVLIPAPCKIHAHYALAELVNFLSSFHSEHSKDRHMVVSTDAPQTLAQLQAEPPSILTVWNGASDKTVFFSKLQNYMYRYHHDMGHLKYGCETDAAGEIYLWHMAFKDMYRNQLSQAAQALIFAEHIGQVAYYMKNGDFPVNQAAFDVSFLQSIGFEFVPGSYPEHWGII